MGFSDSQARAVRNLTGTARIFMAGEMGGGKTGLDLREKPGRMKSLPASCPGCRKQDMGAAAGGNRYIRTAGKGCRGIMEEKNADKKVLGYARISSYEQHEDRQVIALKEMGVPEKQIYIDKQSGKDFDRPQYKRLLRKLDRDCVLFVKSIDRLGRNYADLNEQWRRITKEKGADIVVIDMPILDTRRERNLIGTLISDIVLALLSYVAENERANIRQRQAEGIAAAKARGVKFGRPLVPLPDNFYEVHKQWRDKKLTLRQAAKACGLAESTFFDKARAFEKS